MSGPVCVENPKGKPICFEIKASSIDNGRRYFGEAAFGSEEGCPIQLFEPVYRLDVSDFINVLQALVGGFSYK